MAFLKSTNNANSRYSKGGTTDEFKTRLGWWERKLYTSSSDDIMLVLTSRYHQRPDILSYDVYGKATYMWLVLQYNSILDVTTEFVAGKEIHLPTPKRILIG